MANTFHSDLVVPNENATHLGAWRETIRFEMASATTFESTEGDDNFTVASVDSTNVTLTPKAGVPWDITKVFAAGLTANAGVTAPSVAVNRTTGVVTVTAGAALVDGDIITVDLHCKA